MKGFIKRITLFGLLFLFIITPGYVFLSEGNYSKYKDPVGDIEKAIKVAGENSKRLLLVFGADWCPWCNLLAKYFDTSKDVKAQLDNYYILVKVDIGKWDRNMNLVEKYRVNRKEGIPSIVILDSDGSFVHFQETGSLEEGKNYSDEKVLGFLKKFKKP